MTASNVGEDEVNRDRPFTRPDLSAVAIAAGVSVTSVARTMRGDLRVDPRILRKVWRAVEAIGYVPNPYPRALHSSHDPTIGIVISSSAEAQFSEMRPRIEHAARESGMGIVIGARTESRDQVISSIEAMIRWKVKKLFVFADGESLDALHSGEVSAMLQEESLEATAFSFCFRAGIEQAVQHFAVLGHRRIAYFAFDETSNDGKSIEPEFQRAMTGINAPAQVVHLPEHEGHAYGRETLRGILEQWGNPSAILCATHREALFLLCSASEMGIDVPDGLSIICCNDSSVLSSTRPSLTSLRLATEELGASMQQLLAQRRAGPRTRAAVAKQVIHRQLAVRNSTSYPLNMIRDLPRFAKRGQAHLDSGGERSDWRTRTDPGEYVVRNRIA